MFSNYFKLLPDATVIKLLFCISSISFVSLIVLLVLNNFGFDFLSFDFLTIFYLLIYVWINLSVLGVIHQFVPLIFFVKLDNKLLNFSVLIFASLYSVFSIMNLLIDNFFIEISMTFSMLFLNLLIAFSVLLALKNIKFFGLNFLIVSTFLFWFIFSSFTSFYILFSKLYDQVLIELSISSYLIASFLPVLYLLIVKLFSAFKLNNVNYNSSLFISFVLNQLSFLFYLGSLVFDLGIALKLLSVILLIISIGTISKLIFTVIFRKISSDTDFSILVIAFAFMSFVFPIFFHVGLILDFDKEYTEILTKGLVFSFIFLSVSTIIFSFSYRVVSFAIWSELLRDKLINARKILPRTMYNSIFILIQIVFHLVSLFLLLGGIFLNSEFIEKLSIVLILFSSFIYLLTLLKIIRFKGAIQQ